MSKQGWGSHLLYSKALNHVYLYYGGGAGEVTGDLYVGGCVCVFTNVRVCMCPRVITHWLSQLHFCFICNPADVCMNPMSVWALYPGTRYGVFRILYYVAIHAKSSSSSITSFFCYFIGRSSFWGTVQEFWLGAPDPFPRKGRGWGLGTRLGYNMWPSIRK